MRKAKKAKKKRKKRKKKGKRVESVSLKALVDNMGTLVIIIIASLVIGLLLLVKVSIKGKNKISKKNDFLFK